MNDYSLKRIRLIKLIKSNPFNALVIFAALPAFAMSAACEDLEVADFNSEFRPVPTIESPPTVETAPTIEAAPTTTQFEGFKQAPTAEKFEGFEQAPTVTQADGFKKAPTATKFEGFNEGNPCETFLENPTPRNAEDAVEWAIGQLEGAGGQIDPNNNLQVNAACQAALNR